MKKLKLAGAVLAVGAAAAFALAPVVATAAEGKMMMHCPGVNACKGKSSCKSSENACKGKNSCKGKGFVTMTKGQCEQVGGM